MIKPFLATQPLQMGGRRETSKHVDVVPFASQISLPQIRIYFRQGKGRITWLFRDWPSLLYLSAFSLVSTGLNSLMQTELARVNSWGFDGAGRWPVGFG